MKKAFKILFIALFLSMLAIVATPFLFKGKIVNLLKEQINNNLNATVSFDEDVSLSLIRSFPNFTLGIDEIMVIGKDTFTQDTLAKIKSLELKMDLMSVFSGSQISIRRVSLEEPKIHIKVLQDGRANYEITLSDNNQVEDATEVEFNTSLQSMEIVNGDFLYEDASLDFLLDIKGLNNEINGDFTLSKFILFTKSQIDKLNIKFDGITYLSDVKTTMNTDLDLDLDKMYFGIRNNEITLNDLVLNGEGWYQMGEDKSNMDLSFNAPEVNLVKVLSLIPNELLTDVKDAKTTGTVSLNAFVKGEMTETNIPSFGADIKVNNGTLKYPDLPGTVKDIQVSANISNLGGTANNTIVEVSKFHSNFNGDELDATLLLKTPTSDPQINTSIKGKLDLENLKKSIKIENQKLSGEIQTNLKAKGKLSSIEREQYDEFIADGDFSISNFIYQSEENAQEIDIKTIELNFSPQKVNLDKLEGKIGKSDFSANGKLNNFYSYFFGEEKLHGDINFNSNYFNLNPFLSDEEEEKIKPSPEDTVEMEAIDIPENLDLTLTSSINTLIYDNLKLEEVKGQIQVKDKKLIMHKVYTKIFGGSVLMSGTYDSRDLQAPVTKMDLDISNFNIQETFNYMEILQKFGPVAKFVEGLFSAKINLNSSLDKNLNPNYNSLTGDGSIKLSKAAIEGFQVLDQIGDKLKMNSIKDLELNNVLLGIRIEDGKVLLKDTLRLPVQGKTLKVSGFTKLDQSIEYIGLMNIPREQLGPTNNAWNKLNSEAKSKGINLEMASLIPVQINISGTMTKPKITFSLNEAKKSILGGIKTQVKDQIDEKKREVKEDLNQKKKEAQEKLDAEKAKKKQEILAAANKKSAEIKAIAKSNAEKSRDGFYKQADKVIADSKNKSFLEKKAAEKTAKEIRKKGDQSYSKIIEEGDKNSDTIIQKAQKEVDAL